MYAKTLADLELDENGKIGYTYKCMGAGFWSLRQKDFRASLEAITLEVNLGSLSSQTTLRDFGPEKYSSNLFSIDWWPWFFFYRN